MDFRAEILSETALVIGDPSRSASKKENNVLILAGGAGSGKSFVLSKIIDFEGKLFNVDDLKSKLIDYGSRSEVFSSNFAKKSADVIKDLKNQKTRFSKICKKSSRYT